MGDDPDRNAGPEASRSRSDGPPPDPDAPPLGISDLIGATVAHYRIDECIGRGGMGVVFKAYDLDLDRTVALKFLPAASHGDEGAHRRFIAEARAASALDHPNICTIHQIGEAETGETFIAMAHYEGETIHEKIARGPLNVDEAVGYVSQVARGLAKAHEVGIVHRDIKPANVIVTTDGVAKILDFGLSKVDDQQLTRTGELFGTLDYMSPEQVAGKSVDARSDVWSTGAMLYEMLTGRRPFRAGNPAAVLYAVMHDDVPSATSTNAAISNELEGTIQRCLQKERALRFADAGELAEALGSASASRPAPASGADRRVIAALMIAAILALVALLPVSRRTLASLFSASPALARPFVAVIPTNVPTDPNGSAIAEGLTHTLASALARLGDGPDSLRVVPASEILNQDIGSATQARELFGVNRVVSVSVTSVGGRGVELVLADPTQAQLRHLTSERLPMPEDSSFFDALPAALTRLLSLAPRSGITEAFESDRPASPNAFNYTAQGRGYLRAGYNLPTSLTSAISLFEEALAEDPGYAPALAGLCEALFERGRQTNDTTYTRRGLARCSEARTAGEDQPSVLVPLAAVYLQTGRIDEAGSALRRALDLEPRSAETHRWLARVSESQGDLARAERRYLDAIGLEPGMWVYHGELATFLAYRDRHEEAIPHFEQVRVLAPDNFLGELGLSLSLILSDREVEAESLLRSLIDRTGVVRAYSNLGYLYLRQQRYDSALDVLLEARDRHPNDWWTTRWLAHAAHWSGRADLSRASWERVIEIATPLLEVNARDEDLLVGLAEAFAHRGDSARATAYLELAAREPTRFNYNVFYRGRVYAVLGDWDPAFALIGEAVERGYSLTTIERDQWLDALRGDPRFEGIRARGG
ncbi:MAG: protein kinase [Gemmatimonadetes bacterium]|nr:protein kinase [Gemmatimonadota bacterium]